MHRRDFIRAGIAASALASTTAATAATEATPKRYQNGVSPRPIMMNSATIRPTPLKEQIRYVADAGFDGIEPWMDALEKYDAEGGSVKDLGKEIKDRGLRIANVIGLWDGMPEGDEAFAASLP